MDKPPLMRELPLYQDCGEQTKRCQSGVGVDAVDHVSA